MQQSEYVKAMPEILALLRGEDASNRQQAGHNEETETIHVYPVAGGGMLLMKTPLDESDDQQPPIVESEPPERTLPHKVHASFLRCTLLLFLLLFLDSMGPTLTDLLTPVATITITPNVQKISLHSNAPLGKLLDPITLSESQIVPTTGHRHQDARAATGTLIVYNGLFTSQFVAQGTVFTGSDGVQVATDQSVTIPANAPPVDGQATILAHALNTGQAGNIAAGDISVTINNGLLVKNSPFDGGLDERDYRVVTKTDTESAAKNLQGKVTASMTAALQGQLMQGQGLQSIPCTPTVTADHAIGQEATAVQVTVSETCRAIAYDTHELTTQATRQLSAEAAKTLGSGYQRYGNVHIAVAHATTSNKTVSLSFLSQATFVYQLTAKEQQQMKTLITGKPRLTAIHQLLQFPGIREVNISGIPDNQEVPDPQHITLLIVFLVP